MNYNLKYQSEDNVYSDLSTCSDLLINGKSKALNITIEAKEAVDHFDWFQRQLFLADLLDIHGIFLIGALMEDDIQSISDLYHRTKFSFLGHWLYPNTISLTDMTTSENKQKSEEYPLSNIIRAIVCWNGNEQLFPKNQLVLKFEDEDIKGSIIQIQKIINTDFTGSTFGLNYLKSGQVGTVSLSIEKDVEKVPYKDNHNKGFFVIMDANGSQRLGIGIIIKE